MVGHFYHNAVTKLNVFFFVEDVKNNSTKIVCDVHFYACRRIELYVPKIKIALIYPYDNIFI